MRTQERLREEEVFEGRADQELSAHTEKPLPLLPGIFYRTYHRAG